MVHVSGREVAYDFIRSRILPDPALHDTFLSEEDIAARVGVSRTPVREALMILGTENLVRLVPRRGVYIASPTAREVNDLIQFRLLLERFAGSNAVTRHNVDIDHMKSLTEHQRLLTAKSTDALEFIEADFQFHLTMIDAVDNFYIRHSYKELQSQQLRSGVLAVYADEPRRKAVIDEHLEIIRAIEAGDAELLDATIEKHLNHTREGMLLHQREGVIL